MCLVCSVCKASIVDCYSGDFGGDMNHVHRVGVSVSCKAGKWGVASLTGAESGRMTVEFSVVVKVAPDEVKVSTHVHTHSDVETQ